jgi:glutamine synthetase
MDYVNKDVPKMFGNLVFNDAVMKNRLPKDIYRSLKKTIEEGTDLDINSANSVASVMRDWAIEKGATHFTHWFQPLTGITAEKHESFIAAQSDGTVIMEFNGNELIKGEPDASSFPSGGLRATFEARGYTAWDPTSYAFIKGRCLCIPTVFCSYCGSVLDKKTPLLRSMEKLNEQALRILKLFNMEGVTHVSSTVGPEQEYFLIDKKLFEQRKDLKFCGRTLFGAKPPKGQEMEDHYFGAIRPRVDAFMEELDNELWKLGILAKTEHNEVAPSQHELAPIFTTTNTATDHNQITMEMLKRIAEKHDLACLLHEKPFAGINGSGKHNNWSLSTNTGKNLLDGGKNPISNKMFLLFLTAVIKAVDKHQDLLRIAVTSAGNDHRLGANEAPPAILSIFLGDELTSIMESIADNKEYNEINHTSMKTGVHAIPGFRKDTTDRNRTSPFAFTGNKFEFRMVGSGMSIADANIVLNTIVAESLSEFADCMEKTEDISCTVDKLIKDTYIKHRRIVFNGNNYSEEWVEEANKRGLLNLKTTADALAHLYQKRILSFLRETEFLAKWNCVQDMRYFWRTIAR